MHLSTRATVVTGVTVGLAIGLALYTFVYARGYSYLTNDPTACANCHVMQDYYAGWIKGSHHAVAACNDCHTPHNLLGKYAIKATNGFFHSLAFTSGRFPDNIQIKGYNQWVTEGTCRSCHGEITSAIAAAHREPAPCVRCHFNVGHSAPSFVMSSDLPAPLGHESEISGEVPSHGTREHP